jgi:hypothetical protein
LLLLPPSRASSPAAALLAEPQASSSAAAPALSHPGGLRVRGAAKCRLAARFGAGAALADPVTGLAPLTSCFAPSFSSAVAVDAPPSNAGQQWWTWAVGLCGCSRECHQQWEGTGRRVGLWWREGQKDVVREREHPCSDWKGSEAVLCRLPVFPAAAAAAAAAAATLGDANASCSPPADS